MVAAGTGRQPRDPARAGAQSSEVVCRWRVMTRPAPPRTTRAIAVPAIHGVASEAPVAARLMSLGVSARGVALGAVRVCVVVAHLGGAGAAVEHAGEALLEAVRPLDREVVRPGPPSAGR